MKRSLVIKWAVAALVLVLLAAGVLRAIEARRAQQAAVSAAAKPAETVVQLSPGDVVRATRRELAQTLPVSGTL